MGPPFVVLVRNYPGDSLTLALRKWSGFATLSGDVQKIFEEYITQIYTYEGLSYRVKTLKTKQVGRRHIILDLSFYSDSLAGLQRRDVIVYRQFRPLIANETARDGLVVLDPDNFDLDSWKRPPSPQWLHHEVALFMHLVVGGVCSTNFLPEAHEANLRVVAEGLADLTRDVRDVVSALERSPHTLEFVQGRLGRLDSYYRWQLRGKVPGNILFYLAVANCSTQTDQSLAGAGFQDTELLDVDNIVKLDTAKLRKSWARLPDASQHLLGGLLEKPFNNDVVTWPPYEDAHTQMCACVIVVYFLSPCMYKYLTRISSLDLGRHQDLVTLCLRWARDKRRETMLQIIALMCRRQEIKEFEVFHTRVKTLASVVNKAVFLPIPPITPFKILVDLQNFFCQLVIVKDPEERYGLLLCGDFYSTRDSLKFMAMSLKQAEGIKIEKTFYTRFASDARLGTYNLEYHLKTHAFRQIK